MSSSPQASTLGARTSRNRTDKCAELQRWPLSDLPDKLIRYTRLALMCIQQGQTASTLGWTDAC